MKNVVFILLLSLSMSAKAQQNLVPNPSFEDYNFCPTSSNQVYALHNWINCGISPDYFNACATFGLNVPNSNYGYQYAHSGAGMIGLVTYIRPNACSNCREFVGVELSSPLQIGTKYFMSFFVNYSHASPYTAVASNNIGLKFSTNSFDEFNPPPLNNFAHLNCDSIIQDSINWTFISGSLIADSAYQFLTLGNFFVDSLTSTVTLGVLPYAAYYYLDDICVSTDSILNNTWTGLNNNFFSEESIEPFKLLKSGAVLQIKCRINSDLSIFNLYGQKVFEMNGNNFNINLSDWYSGIYIITVFQENRRFSRKLYLSNN